MRSVNSTDAADLATAAGEVFPLPNSREKKLCGLAAAAGISVSSASRRAASFISKGFLRGAGAGAAGNGEATTGLTVDGWTSLDTIGFGATATGAGCTTIGVGSATTGAGIGAAATGGGAIGA